MTAPSFMAHRQPAKQLRYTRLPAAGLIVKPGGVKGKQGRKGMFQSKLCWG